MSYEPRPLTGALFRSRSGDGYDGTFFDGTDTHKLEGAVETTDGKRRFRIGFGNVGTGHLAAATGPISETHPTHTGILSMHCREYRLAAWLKTSAKGVKYFSLSAKEERAQPPQAKPPAERSPAQKQMAFANAEVGYTRQAAADETYDPRDFDDPLPF